jgi:mannose-6-phosphate isomerase
VLCLEGEVEIATQDGSVTQLTRGQSVFVPASDGALTGSGDATVVQADVP